MEMNSGFRISGKLTVTLRDENGKILERNTTNMVVDKGLELVADWIAGGSEPLISWIGIATGTGPVAEADTTLDTEVHRLEFLPSEIVHSTSDVTQVVFTKIFPAGIPGGTNVIRQAGLFTGSVVGTSPMFCKTKSFGDLTKSESNSLTFVWTITIGR